MSKTWFITGTSSGFGRSMTDHSAEPPRRLALGSAAYRSIGAALLERLDTLERHRDVTLSVDVTD